MSRLGSGQPPPPPQPCCRARVATLPSNATSRVFHDANRIQTRSSNRQIGRVPDISSIDILFALLVQVCLRATCLSAAWALPQSAPARLRFPLRAMLAASLRAEGPGHVTRGALLYDAPPQPASTRLEISANSWACIIAFGVRAPPPTLRGVGPSVASGRSSQDPS